MKHAHQRETFLKHLKMYHARLEEQTCFLELFSLHVRLKIRVARPFTNVPIRIHYLPCSDFSAVSRQCNRLKKLIKKLTELPQFYYSTSKLYIISIITWFIWTMPSVTKGFLHKTLRLFHLRIKRYDSTIRIFLHKTVA